MRIIKNSNKHQVLQFFLLFLIIGSSAVNGKAQNGYLDYDNTELPKLTTKINFNGIIDPGEWDDLPTIPLVSHWPEYSETANNKTNFYIAYNEKFLYFAAMCYDDPALIQAPTFERDNWSMAMDQITLILDPYNDNENAVVFSVTPSGSRIDVSVRNDAQGSGVTNGNWNSFWEAKTNINEEGWMVEARIPLTSLRFQSIEGKVTMGFIGYRYIARNRQLDIFPKVLPDFGFWSFVKPSQGKDLTFYARNSKRPWLTSPYILAATGYHHDQNQEAPEQKIKDHRLNFGLDVQHAITDNINVDLTYNTDFAQVEADDQVINLSRFSLFFPEKRRFFLERSSIMDFRFDNSNRLFYSRRIGINNRSIVPLWGGVRMVGRLNNYDIGLMSMQSRAIDQNNGENFSVFRFRRKVSDNNSYMGAILTTRTDFQGNDQYTYGLDGIINLFKDDYLQINIANSTSSRDEHTYNHILDGRKRLYFLWQRRNIIGFNYAFSYSQVDENYDPAIGFEDRSNYIAIGDNISYGWFLPKFKSIRYMSIDGNFKFFYSSSSLQSEGYLFSPVYYLELNKANGIRIRYNHFYDKVHTAFSLSDDITINSDIYTNRDVNVSFDTPPTSFLRSEFNVKYGGFYNGQILSLGITPVYVISKYITLSGFYQYNRIHFGQGNYLAHVGRIKVSTSLNVKLSINAFLQMNSLSKSNTINIRLRYNPKDGNDFYLVYNEGINGNGFEDNLVPFYETRSIIAKYIYTFHL